MSVVRIRIHRIVGLSGLLSSRRHQLNPANPHIRQILILTVTLFAAIACTQTPGGVTLPPTEPTAVAAGTQAPATVNTPQKSPTSTPRPTPTLTPTAVVPTSATSPTAMPTVAPTNTLEPTPTLHPEGGARVVIDEGDALAIYWVDLAVTPEERTRGLSGRPSMREEQGMLFVYDEDGARTFWMPDMHFPLDMVWIRADCTIAGVTADVPNPPPDTPRDQLELYPSAGMVRFILELNAGQAAMHGIEPGDAVKFDGQIAGQWGC